MQPNSGRARVFGGDPQTGVQWRGVDYSGRRVFVIGRYPIAYTIAHENDLSLFPASNIAPAVLAVGTVTF